MESLLNTGSTSSRASQTKRFFLTLLMFWAYGFAILSGTMQLVDEFEYMREDVYIHEQFKHYKAIGILVSDQGNIPLFQMMFLFVMIMDAFTRMIFSHQWIRGKLQQPSDFFKFGTTWSVLIPTSIVAMTGQYLLGGFTVGESAHAFLDMEGRPMVYDDLYRRADLFRKGWVILASMVVCLVLVKILKDRCESSLMEAQVKKNEKEEDFKNEAPTIILEPDHDLEKGQAEKHQDGVC